MSCVDLSLNRGIDSFLVVTAAFCAVPSPFVWLGSQRREQASGMLLVGAERGGREAGFRRSCPKGPKDSQLGERGPSGLSAPRPPAFLPGGFLSCQVGSGGVLGMCREWCRCLGGQPSQGPVRLRLPGKLGALLSLPPSRPQLLCLPGPGAAPCTPHRLSL